MYSDDEGAGAEDADRRDVAHHIVGQFVECGVGGVAATHDRQRVAVWRGAYRGFRTDRAAATAAVIDDEGLAVFFREFGRQRARHDIGAAAG